MPDLRDGQTVRQSRLHRDSNRLSGIQGGGEARNMVGFDRDDFRLRTQALHRERDSREQTAATDGDNDGLEIRHLLDDFEAHRTLARDDGRIIVTIDVGKATFVRDLVRLLFRLGEILPMQHDRRAELLAVTNLDEGGILRHHDGGRNTEQLTLIGEGLGVISGGGRDYTAFLLFPGQLGQRVPRAPFLKAAGALQVVELAEDRHSRELAQRDRLRAR